MMIALAKAMNASITRVRASVQIASFLNPRLCQELVRSMTHLAAACNGIPRAPMTPSQPRVSSKLRVLPLS